MEGTALFTINLPITVDAQSGLSKRLENNNLFKPLHIIDAKIIDTPGIKGFGVVDMEKEEVGDYFPEFFALKQDCKFNNCIHLNEPKCAVKEALENDEVSYSRYRSYLQILEGEDEHYRTDNWDKE